MVELTSQEIKRAEMAFEVYGADREGKLDAFHLGHALRALGLNPSQNLVRRMGGTTQKNEKKLTLDEFLSIFVQMKQRGPREIGNLDEVIEVLRLYDRKGKGKIILADLSTILQNLGERLDRSDTEAVLKATCPKKNYTGEVQLTKFLNKLLA